MAFSFCLSAKAVFLCIFPGNLFHLKMEEVLSQFIDSTNLEFELHIQMKMILDFILYVEQSLLKT
jgi:hypothetical protein